MGMGVCVNMCVYAQGRNEGEGGAEIERKVGGSIRGKRKRGGDIFSQFSSSHFFKSLLLHKMIPLPSQQSPYPQVIMPCFHHCFPIVILFC